MKARVLTALVLIPIVLLAFAADSVWPVACLALVAAIICCAELGRILGGQVTVTALAAVIAVALFAYWGAYGPGNALDAFAVAAGIGVLASAFLKKNVETFLGPLWVIAPLAAIAFLNACYIEPSLRLDLPILSGFRLDRPILLCIFPIWAGDTAAIFVGKAFGKHKFWPSVSPNKTWEGCIANLVACVAVGGLLAHPFHVHLATGLLLGVSCGVFGQAGDLFESWLKRRADLKDSGSLLPGHGGLLDRMDSLLFAAIPSCLILVTLR